MAQTACKLCGKPFVCDNGMWFTTCTCAKDKPHELKAAQGSMKSIPTKPGFYWAIWLSAAPGTHEGNLLTLPQGWEVVEVWENFIGEPCEADKAEKFAVSVPGVRETQWLENFKWGSGPLTGHY